MQPMLATRGDHVPTGDAWIHEVKWDGIRALVDISDGRARIYTRNENEVGLAYPELHGIAAVADDVLLDGEIVALGAGVPSFSALADRMHVRDAAKALRLAQSNPVTFLAFDVLRFDGEDLTRRPLAERREILLDLGISDGFVEGERVAWQVPPTYADGAMLLQAAEAQGLEGMVSKKLSSIYRPGQRSNDWLKFPIRPTGSYVIGGFRYETGSETRLGAVLIGEPTADGLAFRGRVGSGIAGKAGRRLADLLQPLVTGSSPFKDELPRLDREGTVWVDPQVIIDVQYLNITGDGRLRQPAYRGVRTDLSPSDLEG